jgi:hypothetical protein
MVFIGKYIYNLHVIGEVKQLIKLQLEELDGLAVSALGVRSRKLSTGLNSQS